MVRAWLHRTCQAQESQHYEERLVLETEVLRLRKRLEDLSTAYQALVHATASRVQQDQFAEMLRDAWQEDPGATPVFLTPSLAEREGLEDS